MSTGETLDSTPRWEIIADEFLDQTTAEIATPVPRTTSIADPIGYMRRRNPKLAAEMQQRRDDQVAQREQGAIDPRVRGFRLGSTISAPETPQGLILGVIRGSNKGLRGLRELAKTNPELAAELRAEYRATVDCRRRAASDPDLLGMELD